MNLRQSKGSLPVSVIIPNPPYLSTTHSIHTLPPIKFIQFYSLANYKFPFFFCQRKTTQTWFKLQALRVNLKKKPIFCMSVDVNC